jgi:formylmethanofuran dehydrogenase subunit E
MRNVAEIGANNVNDINSPPTSYAQASRDSIESDLRRSDRRGRISGPSMSAKNFSLQMARQIYRWRLNNREKERKRERERERERKREREAVFDRRKIRKRPAADRSIAPTVRVSD